MVSVPSAASSSIAIPTDRKKVGLKMGYPQIQYHPFLSISWVYWYTPLPDTPTHLWVENDSVADQSIVAWCRCLSNHTAGTAFNVRTVAAETFGVVRKVDCYMLKTDWGVFHGNGVPRFIRENPFKMDDLGYAPFMETPIWLELLCWKISWQLLRGVWWYVKLVSIQQGLEHAGAVLCLSQLPQPFSRIVDAYI